MGKRREYRRRREAKGDRVQSIVMMPRDWLKQLYAKEVERR